MSENSFKFKKGDLEIEFSGEKIYVESQIKNWKPFIENQTNSKSDSFKEETGFPDKTSDNNENHEIKVIKNITLDDFIKMKEPKDDIDKVIVTAYYLERYDKYESFNEIDLYRILNIEDVEKYLLINMEKGLLSVYNKSHNLTNYTLTYSGEIYVREGLQVIF